MLVAALFAASLSVSPLPPDNCRVLLPFDYHGVALTGGVFKTQLDDAREFYLRIPNDDLLLGFRRRAGLPAPGKDLGGWYGSDTFHIFGQILSGLSRLYAATGDPACKEKAGALLDGWVKCIGPDGYFFYSTHPNAPHYIFDKMVGGLVDVATYCGRKDALGCLSKITDWAIAHLDRRKPWLDGGEWYTLSENLYRAYLLTGDAKYREFGKVWEYTTYWSAYAEGRDLFSRQPDGNQTQRYHAYSHVNTLGGAALAYRLTGARHYLKTIINAYDYLQANQCFATGGFGPDESIVPGPRLAELLGNTSSTYETQCGTWSIFKLCKNLIALTGDARYGDWVERAAFNGLAATIPMTPDGRVFYYSDYDPHGATKFECGDGWTCCAGTRPMVAADVTDLIYFRAHGGLNINLFVPSRVQVRPGLEVIQRTRFPETSDTEFEVRTASPSRLALRFRKPGWLAGFASARIDGRAVTLTETAGHWLEVDRTWKNGDRITLHLPMAPVARPLFPDAKYPTAINVGPVTLAFRSGDQSPVQKVDLDHLSDCLIPSAGEPLTFHLRDDPTVLARPYYAYKEGEEYYLYLDPATLRAVPFRRMKRSGRWNTGGRFLWSNEPGAWMEGTFAGDGVSLVGWAFDDAGKASITIDGTLVGEIDQFGPGRDLPWSSKWVGFGPGSHTLRITVLGRHRSGAKDSYVNVGGLEVGNGS